MTREELKLESINEAATKIYSRFLSRNYRSIKEIEPNTDDWNKAIKIGNTIFDAKISLLSKLKEQLPDESSRYESVGGYDAGYNDGHNNVLLYIEKLLTIK